MCKDIRQAPKPFLCEEYLQIDSISQELSEIQTKASRSL